MRSGVLELRDVTYRYPGSARPGIANVDLVVEAGEVVGVAGANDTGKSTLCLVASGLAPASVGGELGGTVTIGGESPAGRRPHELAGLAGIVFQDPAAQRSGITGTVFEEVALGPVNLGLPVEESVERTRAALVGVAVLIAEHRRDVLRALAARLVILDAGRVALAGPAAEVLADRRLDDLGVRP